jgi:hypothetical protein
VSAPKPVRISNRLPQFVDMQQRKAGRVVYAALTVGASEAAALTPQHTSNLINSRFSELELQGAKIMGRTGYTAEYAKWVHEAKGTLVGTSTPRPMENGIAQGNYWDPRGEPKFLEKGFDNAKPAIDRMISGALKV